MYSIKEMYYTLQGEGAQSGRPAVFVRFAGCNLWTGREQDREKAICRFCDTDFVGVDGVNGGQFKDSQSLASAVCRIAPPSPHKKQLVVLTGGEPLLQVDTALIEALKQSGFEVAVETNGTINAPTGLDWVCVSPKAGSEIMQRTGNELKLVFGQENIDPECFIGWKFDHFYLQPMDGPDIDLATKATIEYCKAHPHWKLSLQSHKILDIP